MKLTKKGPTLAVVALGGFILYWADPRPVVLLSVTVLFSVRPGAARLGLGIFGLRA